MISELIVDVNPKEISIAVLEDKKLVEFQKEAQDESFSVGNIYVGRVKKLMPALNAAFVDVGYKKDAFLHYLDLGIQFNSFVKFREFAEEKNKIAQLQKMKLMPDIKKEGRISDVLKTGQEILVQIAKEPISTKGPRLTSEISFAGRFLILIPLTDRVSVSQKIKSREERARLRQLLQSIKPKNYGVIVRTNAEGKRVAELDAELKVLVKRWEDNIPKLLKAKAPSIIYEETARTVAILRDIFSPSFEQIHINNKDVFKQVTEYISLISPDSKKIVKLYSGTQPILDNFGITKQVKSLFGKTVTFKNGAYLIIEHTEALHVIDVNSGNRNKTSLGQEDSAFEVNVAAAEEIARQLRLRDMGGIIVIDFIDMSQGEHRNKLLAHMQEFMAKDRARHNILPLSRFGLLQITRQRVRPEMEIATREDCPTCLGKGKIKASILFTDTLEAKIEYLVKNLGVKKFSLHIHPYVAAYVQQGLFSLKRKWRKKLNAPGLKIVPNQNLGFLQYEFYDTDQNEIDLKDDIEMK
ncbi:MAG: Rne/Rng family ribonuclease [Candidatus Saccharimonadaceae bacterium]